MIKIKKRSNAESVYKKYPNNYEYECWLDYNDKGNLTHFKESISSHGDTLSLKKGTNNPLKVNNPDNNTLPDDIIKINKLLEIIDSFHTDNIRKCDLLCKLLNYKYEEDWY